ncbi:MAG TPA: TIGR04283 family arsenosugar biosynthesis glycosyltransferase [Gammaproteobacteria bacterium]|nr:TIGR04283 family arsenosugar biosynthesis glycosyltransferase [Gammaproteobacteria bacterium]
MTRISVIIPVLNDAAILQSHGPALRALQARGHEVVVVDGGSRDDSLRVAREITSRVLGSDRGRALQMNAGAEAAEGDLLLFLHADTQLEPGALQSLLAEGARRGDAFWGRYDVRLDGDHWLYRVIETMMNLRARFTGIATGDQAMCVSRALFRRVGGFPRIPLMEDVALSKRLRRCAAPACLKPRVVASARRWARHGIVATTLLMWRLRLSYFLGADPARLARLYYGPEIDSGH